MAGEVGKKNYEEFLKSYIKGEEVKLSKGDKGKVEKITKGVANPLQLYRPQGPYASGAGKKDVFKLLGRIGTRTYNGVDEKGNEKEKTQEIRPALLRLAKQYFVPTFTAPKSYCNLGVEMIKGEKEKAPRPRVVLFSQKLNGMNPGNVCRVTLKENLKELTSENYKENEDWYKVINNAALCLDSVEAKRLLLWDIKLPLTYNPPKLEENFIENKIPFFSFVMSRFSIAWVDKQKRGELRQGLIEKTIAVAEVFKAIEALDTNIRQLPDAKNKLEQDLKTLINKIEGTGDEKDDKITSVSKFKAIKEKKDKNTNKVEDLQNKVNYYALEKISETARKYNNAVLSLLITARKFANNYKNYANLQKTIKVRGRGEIKTTKLTKPNKEELARVVKVLNDLFHNKENFEALKKGLTQTNEMIPKTFEVYKNETTAFDELLKNQIKATNFALTTLLNIQNQTNNVLTDFNYELANNVQKTLMFHKTNLHFKILQNTKIALSDKYDPFTTNLTKLKEKKNDIETQLVGLHEEMRKTQQTYESSFSAVITASETADKTFGLFNEYTAKVESAFKEYDAIYNKIYNEEIVKTTYKRLKDDEKQEIINFKRKDSP